MGLLVSAFANRQQSITSTSSSDTLAPCYRKRTRAPAEVKKRCFGGYHAHLLKGTRKNGTDG